MPNYASVGNVQSLFPPISSVTALSSAVIAHYMDNVEALINASIRKRYTTPVTPSCPLLQAIVERETIYAISVGRGLIQFPAAQQGRAPLAVLHAEDVKTVNNIAEGDLVLLDNTGSKIPADTGQILVFSTTMTYNPTFADGLRYVDSVIDDNKETDRTNERLGSGL